MPASNVAAEKRSQPQILVETAGLSVQVMDLLKDVARDRLVIMVTHNPELAYRYATRIVTLADGKRPLL